MSGLSEKQVNDHIRRAVSAITPNHAEALWEKPTEEADSEAWFLEGTEQRKKHSYHYMKWSGLAAACLAVIFLGWFQLYRFTDATVYLDVNPSVSLNVNRIGRVIKAAADNEDGRIILDNMNLHNTDIDVAMNALLGSMVKHGYLSQAQNILLISVNGKDSVRTESLRQKLSADAEQTLTLLLGSGIVLGQTVDLDDAAEEIAETYEITPGKAALILRLFRDQSSRNIEELTAMPMSELVRFCQAAGMDISHYLGGSGEILGDTGSLFDEDEPDGENNDSDGNKGDPDGSNTAPNDEDGDSDDKESAHDDDDDGFEDAHFETENNYPDDRDDDLDDAKTDQNVSRESTQNHDDYDDDLADIDDDGSDAEGQDHNDFDGDQDHDESDE